MITKVVRKNGREGGKDVRKEANQKCREAEMRKVEEFDGEAGARRMWRKRAGR